MNLLRNLIILLGVLGIITICAAFGVVASCMLGGTDANGIPGAGAHANQAMTIGGGIGLVLGVVAAIYYFRRR